MFYEKILWTTFKRDNGCNKAERAWRFIGQALYILERYQAGEQPDLLSVTSILTRANIGKRVDCGGGIAFQCLLYTLF